jgi:hypothetical protein
MSRSFTLAQLKTRLDEMTDTENDTHLSENEKYAIIASACAETWDKVISSGLSEQYVVPVTFSSVAGQQEYSLSSIVSAGDFYKVASLAVTESTGRNRVLPKLNPAEVYSYQPPQSVYTLKLHYIPAAPTFKTAGVFDTALTFDGISGWEEHALNTAAVTVKNKREEDPSVFLRRKAELEERIQAMANTDWSEPARVTRRNGRNRGSIYTTSSPIVGWLPRGSKIELFERSVPWLV